MGTFKPEVANGNPAGSSCTGLNNGDISYIKGSSISSDISYFRGLSGDFGVIHQLDGQISDNSQKAFIIKENEFGFYLETFIISYQAIEKMKVFPLKSEVLDYLRNFKENKNLCQGIKEELMFQNLSNLFPGSFRIEKTKDGVVYKSRACLIFAEDEQKTLCEACENIFNVTEDGPKEVNPSHYYELDSEDIDNSIKNDPSESECLKVDINPEDAYTKNDMEDLYFEDEKDPIVVPTNEHFCKQCDGVFNTKSTLYHHNERCHRIKTDKNNVENEVMHVSTSNYLCDKCNAVFRYKRTFYRHMKHCHSIEMPPLPKNLGSIQFKSLKCAHCDKAFSATHNYNKHLRDVHGEGVYVPEKRIMKKCLSCEEEFNVSKSSYKLVCHIRNDHHDEDLNSVIEELELGDKGRVVCQIGGEAKRNKYILANHIQNIHEQTGEMVPCHICGKLLRQNCMYSHIKSHNTESYPCKYCGKVFKDKMYAKHHIESHEPDLNKMECKECGVMFLRINSLRKHQRNVHLGIKTECDICGKMFSSKSKMNRHKNSVHQEKQFSCELCEFRSARKDNLNSHTRRNHGVNKNVLVFQIPKQLEEVPHYLKDPSWSNDYIL